MNKNKYQCPMEQEVVMNLESGDIKSHIQEHIKECGLCRETSLVYGWLNQFKQEPPAQIQSKSRLPSADIIWEGAFAHPLPMPSQDTELVKKAMLPLLIPQFLTYVALFCGFVYVLISHLPGVQKFLNGHLGVGAMIHSLLRFAEKGAQVPLLTLLPVAITLVTLVIIIIASETYSRDREKNTNKILKN